MNKLIRDIPNEVGEELERRAKEMKLQTGTYIRLLLIHAAMQEQSVFKEWAAKKIAPKVLTQTQESKQEDSPSLSERDRYQLAVDTGTVEYYYDNLRREAFRRDEQQKEEK